MKDKYYLLFKTGDAELRALKHTNIDFSRVIPIIELTRGRKSKYDKIGNISKRIEKIAEIFCGQKVCLDITSAASLGNPEIDELYDPEDGYKNWVSFLMELQSDGVFEEIIPTILVDTEDEKLTENLRTQVKRMTSVFKSIVYRNNIIDDGCYDDIDIISEYFNNTDLNLNFVIDCEYVPTGAYPTTVELINTRISKIKRKVPTANFIIVSTSFPRYVSDIGNDDYDIFPLNEIDIYNEVKKEHPKVQYGDYASVNPIRNDTVTMARGWIPRIDVPTLQGIYYYRIRNTIKDYALTYSRVAKKVYLDEKFPHDMAGNWGIKQIMICKEGDSPGSSPSYWISVRISIFIAMQLKHRFN